MSVIAIYGPPASGKTANTVALQQKHHAKSVLDNYVHASDAASIASLEQPVLILTQYREDALEAALEFSGSVLSIEEALKAI